jgi:hypothetical protein
MLSEKIDFITRVTKASKLPVARANDLAEELWGMGPASKKLAEAGCNRELTEFERVYDEKMDARVREIGVELGLDAYRQDDPRGWTIRVKVPRELANNWDGITTGCG